MNQWKKSYRVTIQTKATEQYFPVVLFIMRYTVVLRFESADEILWCDHSNATSFTVLSLGTICFSAFYKMKCRNLLNFDFGQLRHWKDQVIFTFFFFYVTILKKYSLSMLHKKDSQARTYIMTLSPREIIMETRKVFSNF